MNLFAVVALCCNVAFEFCTFYLTLISVSFDTSQDPKPTETTSFEQDKRTIKRISYKNLGLFPYAKDIFLPLYFVVRNHV